MNDNNRFVNGFILGGVFSALFIGVLLIAKHKTNVPTEDFASKHAITESSQSELVLQEDSNSFEEFSINVGEISLPFKEDHCINQYFGDGSEIMISVPLLSSKVLSLPNDYFDEGLGLGAEYCLSGLKSFNEYVYLHFQLINATNSFTKVYRVDLGQSTIQQILSSELIVETDNELVLNQTWQIGDIILYQSKMIKDNPQYSDLYRVETIVNDDGEEEIVYEVLVETRSQVLIDLTKDYNLKNYTKGLLLNIEGKESLFIF